MCDLPAEGGRVLSTCQVEQRCRAVLLCLTCQWWISTPGGKIKLQTTERQKHRQRENLICPWFLTRQRFDSRWKHNGHRVVHNAFSKQQSVEVPVCVELIEDGQHRHCTQIKTEVNFTYTFTSCITSLWSAGVMCHLGPWQRWWHQRKGSRCSRTCQWAVRPPASAWPRRTSGSCGWRPRDAWPTSSQQIDHKEPGFKPTCRKSGWWKTHPITKHEMAVPRNA